MTYIEWDVKPYYTVQLIWLGAFGAFLVQSYKHMLMLKHRICQ